ncbi:MAG TPA: histidine kinase dimerization/phospho-acceptor domain-containing protein, partial [Gemmatimonadaceae bacterium]|nr:histidine kinase dimerization/phospho-acceptor domain-containing protein [Gemmatimonadaceae bacterium]
MRLTPRAVPAILPLDDVQRHIVVAAEEARRIAEDANQAKLDWLRAMSHELRTPLNAIGGFVQLLKSGARGELSDKVISDLDRIERNQRHMASLIEEVLHVARLEAGRVHFEVRAMPVSRLLLDLHDYVPQDEKARGRLIAVRRGADDMIVLADEDKARQILINLVANALKHTPVTAAIDVHVDDTRRRPGFAAIAV